MLPFKEDVDLGLAFSLETQDIFGQLFNGNNKRLIHKHIIKFIYEAADGVKLLFTSLVLKLAKNHDGKSTSKYLLTEQILVVLVE